MKELRAVASQIDEIAKKSPGVPDSVYDSVQTRVAERPIVGLGAQVAK